MGLLNTANRSWEREYQAVWRREQRFLCRYQAEPERSIDCKLTELAPETLVETLHAAFIKAFGIVFKNGDGIIQRAGRLSARRETFQIHEYAANLREDQKRLRTFSKAAKKSIWGNVLLSGAAGTGLGALGIALPDVPLFTALLLKSVYETAESFGFPWESEKLYALRIIEGALSYGEMLVERNRALDVFAQTGNWPDTPSLDEQMNATARQLSKMLVCGKMIQNIPVVGVVGGAQDALCLNRVQQYAAIKYYKRFLLRRRLERKRQQTGRM